MNIKALFFFLALSRVNAFIIIGPSPQRVELSAYSLKTTVQQHGRTKSRKATRAEFISRSGQGSTTWPYVSNVSSFQDQIRVQKRGRTWATRVHFKIRPGFNNVAVQSLKRLPELSSFQDQESFQQRGQVTKKMDKKKTFLRRFGENLF